MPQQDGGLLHLLAEKMRDVCGVFGPAIAMRDVGGFPVTAKVECIDVPTQHQAGDQGQKNLPAAPQTVQKYKRRSIVLSFGVIQPHVARVEHLFFQSVVVLVIVAHGAAPASYTILPPRKVFSTFTSRIFSGGIENRSSLRITMSASFPGVIEPFT